MGHMAVLGIVFSPKFQNSFSAKYETKKDINALGLSNAYIFSNLIFMVPLNDHVKTWMTLRYKCVKNRYLSTSNMNFSKIR